MSLPILFILLFDGGARPTSAWLALPLLIAVQYLFVLGLAYPLATLHVWFRDTQYMLRVALQLLFYLTPVFYQTSTIPARFQHLYALNPMVWLVEGYRAILLHATLPPAADMTKLLLLSLALLAAGLWSFRLASRHFADEL
jgi:lipopolysaccharide transport system permease protein